MIRIISKITACSLTVIILLIISGACEESSDQPFNKELIFPEALEIRVPLYLYQSGEREITVHGDEGFKNNIVDTVTPMPVLKWDSLETELIVAAIFSSPIQELNGEISNTGDIVCIWHSGLEQGVDGLVSFTEGRRIAAGDLDSLSPPQPLPAMQTYYWGVWSWDDSGIKIIYSSRQLTFYVK